MSARPSPFPDRVDVLAGLRRLIAEREGRGDIAAGRSRDRDRDRDPDVHPTGLGPLDDALPGGGLRPGTVADWASAAAGGGAWTLALLAARRLREGLGGGRRLVVFDIGGEGGEALPTALSPLVPPAAITLVRVPRPAAVPRVLERCLRCPAVACVVAGAPRCDARTVRRLRSAAESSGAFALLVRDRAAPLPDAPVRLAVRPLRSDGPRRLRRFAVDLERAPGLGGPLTVHLELHLETGIVSAPAGLCDPQTTPRARRHSG